MAHQLQLQNKKYRQWVKAGLGLGYLKDGLAPFCNDIAREQHKDILERIRLAKSLPPTATCGTCTVKTLQPDHKHVGNAKNKICPFGQEKCNCCFTGGKIACPNKICGAIYDKIIQSHASTPPAPNWKNTNSLLWSVDPWSICKCFIYAPGYEQTVSATDVDSTGLLHLIINNMYFHSHIGCNLTAPNNLFLKVRQYRNDIFHSSNMELEEAEANTFISDMINILQDGKDLIHRTDAKNAVLKLQELKKKDFVITTEGFEEVLRQIKEEMEKVLKSTENVASKEEYEDLKEQLTELDTQMSKEKERKIEGEKKHAELIKKLTEFETQMSKEKDGKLEAEQKHEKLQKKLTELETQMFKEKVGKIEAQKEHTELIKKLTEFETQMSKEKDGKIEAEKEHAELKKKLTELHTQMSKEKEGKIEADKEHAELKKKLTEIETLMCKEKEGKLEAEKEYAELKKKLTELELQMSKEKVGKIEAEQKYENLQKKLTELETQMCQEKEKKNEAEKEHNDLKRMYSVLEKEIKRREVEDPQQKQLKYEKDCRENLIEHYRNTLLQVSSSPLVPGQKCNFIENYVRPTITREKKSENGETQEEEVKSMSEIFTKNGVAQKSIYILGDAGSGKTSFCKYLISCWCTSHSERNESDNESHKCGMNNDDNGRDNAEHTVVCEEQGDRAVGEVQSDHYEEHGDVIWEYVDFSWEHGDDSEEHGDDSKEHGGVSQEQRDHCEEHEDIRGKHKDECVEHGDDNEEHGSISNSEDSWSTSDDETHLSEFNSYFSDFVYDYDEYEYDFNAYEQKFNTVKELKRFDFLFYIPLRRYQKIDDIDDMLEKRYKMKLLGEQKLSRVLILLDGLDEWCSEYIPETSIFKEYTIVTTSRPCRIHTLRFCDIEIDQLLKLKGFNSKCQMEMMNRTVSHLNATKSAGKKVIDCKRKLKEKALTSLRKVPITLQQLICLWFDGKLEKTSKCAIYTGMLELFFTWNDMKTTGTRAKSMKSFHKVELPQYLRDKDNLRLNRHLIYEVSKLAYEALFNCPKDKSLTFDIWFFDKLEIPDEVRESCLKLGILTEDECPSLSVSEPPSSLFSFIHKSMQEYLAAVNIAINFMTKMSSSDSTENVELERNCVLFVNEVFQNCSTVNDILEQSNVIIMLCGLEPNLATHVSKYTFDIVSEDWHVQQYRRTLKLDKSSYIYSKLFLYLNVPMFITDIQKLTFDVIEECNASCLMERCPVFNIGDLVITDGNQYQDIVCSCIDKQQIVADSVHSIFVDHLNARNKFAKYLPMFHHLEKIVIVFGYVWLRLGLPSTISNIQMTDEINNSIIETIKVNTSSLKSLALINRGTNDLFSFFTTVVRYLPSIINLAALCIENITMSHDDTIHLCNFLEETSHLEQLQLLNVKCKCWNQHNVNLSKHHQLEVLHLNETFNVTDVDTANLETFHVATYNEESYDTGEDALQYVKDKGQFFHVKAQSSEFFTFSTTLTGQGGEVEKAKNYKNVQKGLQRHSTTSVWHKCIERHSESDIKTLLESKVLPSQKELDSACRVFGKRSKIFSEICLMISHQIKKRSENVLDVWPSYTADLSKSVVFVVTVRKNFDFPGYQDYEYIKSENDYMSERKCVAEKEMTENTTDDQYLDEVLEKIRNCINKNADDLLEKHSNLNVILPSLMKSVGFGSDKHVIEVKPCIALYVSVKGYIPRDENPFEKEIDGFPTDVLEGEFEPFLGGPNHYHEHLKIGLAIHANVRSGDVILGGTLGGFIEHSEHGLCGLTSAHVVYAFDELKMMKDAGQLSLKKKVYQPINGSSSAFGEVVLAVYNEGSQSASGMEIAVINIQSRQPLDGSFPESFNDLEAGFDSSNPLRFDSGEVREVSAIRRRTEVFKYGMSSGITRGSFALYGGVIRKTMQGQSGSFGYTFKNQMKILQIGPEPFAEYGDSGSLVMIEETHGSVAIGIVTGGMDDGVFVTPICDILRAVGCSDTKMCKFTPVGKTDLTQSEVSMDDS